MLAIFKLIDPHVTEDLERGVFSSVDNLIGSSLIDQAPLAFDAGAPTLDTVADVLAEVAMVELQRRFHAVDGYTAAQSERYPVCGG